MMACEWLLDRKDIKSLKITDPYALHCSVYELFEKREGRTDSAPSRNILFVDKGGIRQGYKIFRRILILSPYAPKEPRYGNLRVKKVPENFFQYDGYRFEIKINPSRRNNQSRKIIPLRNRKDIGQWFQEKSPNWGFRVSAENLDIHHISVLQFSKKGHKITLGSAIIQGVLEVTQREKFIQSFQNGIGRGKAFGFGLLQIVPLLF